MEIRMILAMVFIGLGMILCVISVLGTFRFGFVLNRMHAAAIADTGGLFLCLTGLCLISGFSFTTLKFVAVVLFFWFASPVTGHLISNLVFHTMEKDTGKNADMVSENDKKNAG